MLTGLWPLQARVSTAKARRLHKRGPREVMMTNDYAGDPQEVEEEARYLPTVERVYRNEAIEVLWEPSLCIHVGACFTSLLPVFDPRRRPWVDVNAATPDEIAEVVR